MAIRPEGFEYIMVIPKSLGRHGYVDRDPTLCNKIQNWLFTTLGPEGVRWQSNDTIVGCDMVFWFKRESDMMMAKLKWL